MLDLLRSSILPGLVVALSVIGLPFAQAEDAPKSTFEITDDNQDGNVDVEEYRARMVEIFLFLDKDGDGFIVLAEVADDFKPVFEEVDVDSNERIILREYLVFHMPRFWHADSDGNNVLSPSEVAAANKREGS